MRGQHHRCMFHENMNATLLAETCVNLIGQAADAPALLASLSMCATACKLIRVLVQSEAVVEIEGPSGQLSGALLQLHFSELPCVVSRVHPWVCSCSPPRTPWRTNLFRLSMRSLLCSADGV